jgi:hypothetical protein
VAGIPAVAERTLRRRLEEAKRLTALQVDTLAHAVESLDDEVGWARLTELGTSSTVRAQESASAATMDALNATLEAVDLVGDIADLPGIRPGQLASGKPVRGMFAATRDIVARRMTAPDTTFPMALDASAKALVGFAASEPHRIGRDGQLSVGMSDDRFNRYRRVAVGNTCTFCLMLASRGAVYLTAASAGQGRRYHHMCDCYVELVVDQDAIARSQALQGDWRNAIRDPQRMREVGALRGVDVPEVPAVATPAPFRHDADTVQRLTNADLESEMKSAWDTEDWDAADVFESEVDRRQKWADGWGRSFDEYDDFRPLDDLADEADLPTFADTPEPPTMSRRAVRAEWEADQELRMYDAESVGGGIHPEMRAEAQSKGITLATLMNGDPRTAYKYANQELLKWWAENGRNPLYELEAKHGRLDSTKLANARMTESRARERAERLLGKDRREGVAQLDAERRATKRRRGV